MREVLIRDALPGMVLAEPATDLLGNALLEAGEELTADHLRTFRAWGVRSIQIDVQATRERHATEDSPSPAREQSKRRRRKSTRIFRRDAEHERPAPKTSAHNEQPLPKLTIADQLNELNFMFESHTGHPLMMNIKGIAEHQLRRRSAKGET